jgi:predicted molibdopterin-dependent oxidoreductase YjgC
VSGDAAASDPQVRQLAEHARATVALTLFAGDSGEWADLVLPATSYLERSGTMRNLEGRLQRLRGATGSPVRPELSWLVELAERLGVELPGSEAALFAELSAKALDGVSLASLGDRAPLPPRGEDKPFDAIPAEAPPTLLGGPLELIRYRALFSGPEVEHVAELSFQRAAAEVEISPEDADRRGIKAGDEVVVRVNPALLPGSVRIAAEHCVELARGVEVSRP